MRKPTLCIGSAALAVVAGLAATHAAAQDAADAAGDETARGREIIVTAQKRASACSRASRARGAWCCAA